MLLEGVLLPLTTPFHPDGRLNLPKLAANVRRYSLTPAAGLVVAGPHSEAAGLDAGELRALYAGAIAEAAPTKVMLAGIARPSVFGTLALADEAAALGYDAVLVHPPLAGSAELYLETVADRSLLPVVVWSETSHPVAEPLLARLARHPRVVGALLDTLQPTQMQALATETAGVEHQARVTTVFAAVTRRMVTDESGLIAGSSLAAGGSAVTAAGPMVKSRAKRVGFQVLAGSAREMLRCWRAGATGAVPALAACAPQGVCEVWQAFRDGDQPLADEKQARVEAAAALAEGAEGVALTRHGCDLNGYFGGRPRLPLTVAEETARARMEAALAGLRT